MQNQITQGNCLDVLKTLDAESVDCCVTDPPYGLGAIKDLPGLLTAWMAGEDGKKYQSKGFMGKGWDIVPAPIIWREVYRVLKPGAHLLAFAGTRTADLMGLSIRLAGFENRDTIEHFQGSAFSVEWLYGVGFPKSLNLGDGRGTALKPSHEPILLFRKPVVAGTIASNVVTWGTGALNIDATRIPVEQGTHLGRNNGMGQNGWKNSSGGPSRALLDSVAAAGRWPSNVVFTHSIWCTPDACSPDCPVFQLDAQAGERKSGTIQPWHKARGIPSNSLSGGKDGSLNGQMSHSYEDATNSASRFFPQFWPDAPASFCYIAKPTRTERDKGCELLETTSAAARVNRKADSAGMQSPRAGAGRTKAAKNNHPTVKPVDLARWLCRLACPPGGIVVDPFCGSGSILVAAAREDRRYIGIDEHAPSITITRNRLGAEHGIWEEVTPCGA